MSTFLGKAAAAVIFTAALCQSGAANAGSHGGGGGGFHGGGFRGDGFHDGGFGRFRGGFGVLGWPYYAYPYYAYPHGSDYYPDYDYSWGQYGNSYTWYYCSDPAGYYPYVAQCNTGWQAVPAS
jgi:hypothetical protein